jgi:hypothetical protein
VRSEEDAAGAALAWLNHAREERAAHTPDLVAVLRVEALSAATRSALQRRLHSAVPPPSRTNWTRLVHPSVLTGHVS